MNAITYLRAKGILKYDCTKWLVKFKGGSQYDVIELLEEYAKIKMEEINNKKEYVK